MKKSEEEVIINASIVTLLTVAALFIVPLVILGIRSCSATKGPEYIATNESLRVECVDGHKFVVYRGAFGGGVSQMLTLDEKGSLVPSMCAQKLTP